MDIILIHIQLYMYYMSVISDFLFLFYSFFSVGLVVFFYFVLKFKKKIKFLKFKILKVLFLLLLVILRFSEVCYRLVPWKRQPFPRYYRRHYRGITVIPVTVQHSAHKAPPIGSSVVSMKRQDALSH